MRFVQTALAGAWVIEAEPQPDERGWFARTFCQEEFAERGLTATVAQANASFTRHTGTLRGMHYQRPPAAEAKVVRCLRGAIHDVIVDLRPDSPTHLQWIAVELRGDELRSLYVPPRFAHGFQSLVDDTEVGYLMSEPYAPDLQGGFRWDDAAIGIDWPLEVTVVSDRDAGLPRYQLDRALDAPAP